MSEISLYLLTIVGVVILLVLIDLILPTGQTSKYIKSISAIFLVLVICTPIVKIFQGNIDFSKNFFDFEYALDTNYLYNIQLKEAENLGNNIKKLLENNGFVNTDVIINISNGQSKLQITSIFIDLSKTVLDKNEQHINNYTLVKELVAKYSGVKEECIFVDG